MMQRLFYISLYFAWVVSLTGFLTSLYFGEVLSLEPCRLCWYQRASLFPLALLLGIATYRNDRTMAGYCIPLSLIGMSFALYQILEQYFPSLQNTVLCDHSVSCRESVFTLFGFMTFPMVSAMGFFLIFMFLVFSLFYKKKSVS